jgi:hypothetical protein
LYETGSGKTRDMEFLVTRRFTEEASTPAYHALTTVLRSPKARITMAIPRIVNDVRRV